MQKLAADQGEAVLFLGMALEGRAKAKAQGHRLLQLHEAASAFHFANQLGAFITPEVIEDAREHNANTVTH